MPRCLSLPSLVLLSVALALPLVACDGADLSALTADQAAEAEPDQAALRKLILEATASPLPPEQDPVVASESAGPKGTAKDCVFKRFTGNALYESLVSFDPNGDSIWPGAVVQGETLGQGLAAPIGLSRRPGTITVSDAVLTGERASAGYSKNLQRPSLAATRDAIAEVIGKEGVKFAARSSYLAETAYSMNEAALKVGLSASWITGSVKTHLSGDWLTRRTSMIVRFVQSYYTVSFAAPPAPEKIFGKDVTADDARPYVRPGNPPGYVSSVTYGRMLLMKIESDVSESDLRAALDVAFSPVAASVAGAKTEVLRTSSVSVFVLGGSPDDAARLQSSDGETRQMALAEYIRRGANFDPTSPGVPIAYTVRRLADNQAVRVASTIDYQVPVCVPASSDLTLAFDQMRVKSDGKAGGSTAADYELWLESSALEGAAAPATPPSGEQKPVRQEVAKGTSSIDDGSSIALSLTRFTKVPEQEGATLTVGGKIRSDASGKKCEMKRQHSFRFDPATNAGQWTNIGKNVLTCADGDSALFGNNSLSVDLDYTLTAAP